MVKYCACKLATRDIAAPKNDCLLMCTAVQEQYKVVKKMKFCTPGLRSRFNNS